MQMNTDATALICGTNLKFIAIRPPYNRTRMQLLAKQFELRLDCNLLVEEELGRHILHLPSCYITLSFSNTRRFREKKTEDSYGILFHLVLQNVPHIFNLAALLLSLAFRMGLDTVQLEDAGC